MIERLLQAERALEMGRVDAAETLYQQVVASDPRNAIAVVGLARVILERGDELGAYLMARRAQSIDPENAAAGRMVARLAEVMRFRGDPVPEGDAGAAAAGVVAPHGPAEAVEPVDPEAAATIARPAPTTVRATRTPRRSLLDRLLRRQG